MCQSCQASHATNGLHKTYDCPKCIYCTARLIKQLATLRTPTSDQITARRQAVLVAAVTRGHAEADVRALVKSGPYLAPVDVKNRG